VLFVKTQGRISVFDPSIQYESIKFDISNAIDRVLRSGQFIMGEDVLLFEQEIAQFLGVKFAISMNSGTDALQIALRTMGVGEGDEVITTPFSFFATAEAISHVGASPVFVDIDASTFNIDPKKIESAISSKTKVIIPVHLYGRPCNMSAIVDVARKFDVLVLEDCAQSFGAKVRLDSQLDMYTGTVGLAGAFSFFPTKNLGAYGDGGMLVTNDDLIAEKAKMLRVHGSKLKYHNEMFGYNSRLDTIQAAILRVKLHHISRWNQMRVEVAKIYERLLNNIDGVILPEISEGHVFHQYTIRVLNGNRDLLKSRLEENGISTMIYYPIPQDQLPVYSGQYVPQPISWQITNEILSLPMYPELTESVQSFVAQNIINLLKEITRK
jgi:dTDP-4-amino-4,6-dideoxygalactose transaminase